MFFAEWFLELLIVGSLLGAAIGAISLIVLFIRDSKSGEVW
jgi:hypothetical protein